MRRISLEEVEAFCGEIGIEVVERKPNTQK